MSTILKSLKKLEQEKEANRYSVQATGYTGPGGVAATGGPSRWTKSTWIRRSLLILMITGLGASSYYFYRQSQRQTPSVSDMAENAQSPVDPKPTVKGTIGKPSGDNPPLANPRPMVNAQGQVNQMIQEPARKPVGHEVPAASASNRRQEHASVTRPAPQRPSSAPHPIRDPKPDLATSRASRDKVPQTQEMAQKGQAVDNGRKHAPIAAIPAKRQMSTNKSPNTVRPAPMKEARPSDTYDALRQLAGGNLKIHAIVWSDTQSDRMAVINTQIVHEGDNVSGFDVVAIRPDDVVVRGEDGGMYRALFGRP